MKLTDLFKFKLFERKDVADLAVVNENFQTAESGLTSGCSKLRCRTRTQSQKQDMHWMPDRRIRMLRDRWLN